jgi:hypothetical protein
MDSGTRPVVVRLSRGAYALSKHPEVARLLEEGSAYLLPAIQRLSGLVHYYVGADAVSGTLINISVWERLAQAQQMSSLREMHEQRALFLKLGVHFDPIVNYQTLWSIAP